MSSNSDQSNIGGVCEYQDNLSILRQIAFFSGLPIELLKVIAYLCVREVLRPGQYLFSQDDDDGCSYYIISGKAELLRNEKGVEYVIKTYEDDTFLGILSLLGYMPRLFSLRVKEPTVCLIMTREKFAKAVERFPEIMPKLIQTIINRISLWDKQALQKNADCWQKKGGEIGISVI
jgi:CRP-like cAMP-binding protein